MKGPTKTVLFVVFALTGFSALTLQVVWQRVIALHSGVDLVSFTTVVAAFLAGLGLGSLLGGWLADRLGPRRSVLLFATSNLAIGLFAWISIWLFYDVYEAQAANLGSTGAKFVFNVALLLVPTTLMGLSLPLVARGVVSRADDAGPLIGRLYAVNTLGAAAGAAAAGWLLLGTFGFLTAVRLAGLLNVVAAGLVLLAVRAEGTATVPATSPPAPVAPRPRQSDAPHERVWPWFVVYGLTGAVALGFELVFFRVVDGVMRSNSYSFPHVLAAYLAFFGIGAALGSVLVRRVLRPDRWFLALQFAVGLTALAGLIVLVRVTPHTPWAEDVARFFAGDGFATGLDSAAGGENAFLPVFFGLPLLIMGAPVLCMGAAFPCAQALVNRRVDTLGRRTGLLVFANIVGNVVGTLLVGFVAIDHLGTTGTYRLLAALLVVPGVAAAWLAAGRRRFAYLAATVAVLVVFLVATPSNQRFWSYLHTVPQDRLELAEDRSCATALKETDGLEMMTVNAASQNAYPFDDFHVLIGLMPAIVHDDPESVMALGLGIGATAYGLASDPRADRVTTVEICGGQIDLLQGLAAAGAPELQAFFADPRQDVRVTDGRDHLLRTDERFDVVVVDTLRPQAAFSGNLYSLEFYDLVKSRMAPGGLLAQWTPTPRTVNTITESFDHVLAFRVGGYGDSPFVLASDEPVVFDRAVVLAHLEATRDRYSPEQYESLRAFLDTAVPECLRDGSPAPTVPDDALNRDLEPRDEYFLNNEVNVARRPPACGG